MPLPPAEFSPLAIIKSGFSIATKEGSLEEIISLPGKPTISLIKIIFIFLLAISNSQFRNPKKTAITNIQLTKTFN
jgi:hypothetical protein